MLPTGPLSRSARTQGTCYGFAIHSTISLACLRDGHGPLLEVAAAQQEPDRPLPLLAEWHDPARLGPSARLYRDGHDFWVWIDRGGWTRIETNGPRITVPAHRDSAASEEHLWTIPVPLCLLYRGDLALHAAAVEVDGEAVLIAASGGSGKSTLAAALVQAGSRLLSEDVTCVRIDGRPCVIPGPTMLRLRPDVLSHIALPQARVIRQIRSRVTFALDQGAPGECTPVPVRVVYLLEAPSAEIARNQISAAEGIRRLWPMAFRLPLDGCTERCFGHLADLAAAVPIRSYRRPARLEELPQAVVDLRE